MVVFFFVDLVVMVDYFFGEWIFSCIIWEGSESL